MRHVISGYIVHLGLLAALAGSLVSSGARAEAARGSDGSVVMRMCKGADKVKALHAAGQRVFVAVGALHMVGPQGLPALLAEAGFQVEPFGPGAR